MWRPKGLWKGPTQHDDSDWTMAVALRLKRFGRRHRPFYRIEAIEKRNARDGKSLETVGHYDPMVEDPQQRVKLDLERVKYWIDQGARPSQTVSAFIRKVDITWGNPKRKNRKSLQRKRRAARKASQ